MIIKHKTTKGKKMSNVGEIVTVITMMGEIVGRLKEETDTGESAGGFAPGLSMTGDQHPKSAHINKDLVLTVVVTHDQVAKGWQEAVSSIIIP